MSERNKNRAVFPQAAKFLDDFRAVFGEGVKMGYAAENGAEIGSIKRAKFEIDGADYLRLGQQCRDNKALAAKGVRARNNGK